MSSINQPPKPGRYVEVRECPLAMDSLIGSHCHQIVDGEFKLQGVVVGEIQPGQYLVQLFDWKTSLPSHQILVPSERMMMSRPREAGSVYTDEEWRFYDSDEEMRKAYDFAFTITKDRV